MDFALFALDLSRIMRRVLRAGDSFVDCGANTGCLYVWPPRSLGGQVVSINANPYCVERIREDKAAGHYASLDIIPCAIGGQDGEIEFTLANDPMYSSLANLNALELTSTTSTIAVPLRKLDDILRNSTRERKRPVRLLRLDVEGAEIDVLRVADSSFNAKSPDYIYVGVHEKQIRLRG
jgi:FkbM family methyltransferase